MEAFTFQLTRSDDPNHLKQFCPHVRADHEQGVIHTNENRRLVLGPRGRNGPELSTCLPSRDANISMRDVVREAHQRSRTQGMPPALPQGAVLLQGQAAMPPQGFVTRWQLNQRTSAQVTFFRKGVIKELSAIDSLYESRAGQEKEEDKDEDEEEDEEEEEEEEEAEKATEEDRDARLDEEERRRQLAVLRTVDGVAHVDESVTKVYRDLHHGLQKASLHGKSGWSLGVAEGPAAQGYPAQWWEEQIA